MTPSKEIITSELSEHIHTLLNGWGIPGLALAVVRPDGEVELKGFGVADDKGTPVTPDTLFGIASCSKAFCAFSSGILMYDYETDNATELKPLPSSVETLNWHTRVKSLLPDWQMYDKHAEENMQIIDLVSHQSGLPTHDLAIALGEKPEDVIRRLPYILPNRDLREEWQYNNIMFMTNTLIVSKLSSMRYVSFVKKRILEPLKMTSSTYFPSEAAATGRFSSAFTWAGPNKDIRRTEEHFIPTDDSVDLMAGGGGIISTARDMTNWLKLLLARGVNPHSGERLVSEKSFKYMTSGHFVGYFGLSNNPPFPEMSVSTYSAGWFVHSYQGHQTVYHTGGTPGISAYQVFLPNDGLGICILTNLGRRQEILMGLMHRIVEDAIGLPRIDWDTRCRANLRVAEAAEKVRLVARAPNAHPSLPIDAYSGTYNSPAYGRLTLVSPSSASTQEAHDVISAFRSVDASPSAPFIDDAQTPKLYARYPRIWGTHLRLRHRSAETWDTTLESVHPEGHALDKTPFTRVGDGPFKVEFVVKEGSVKQLVMYRYSLAQNMRSGDEESAKVVFEKLD